MGFVLSGSVSGLVFLCVSLCSFPASLHSVLLDPTYLWFTFQLCFFPSSVSASFFLLFSFISCLLFGFACALKNFTECGNKVSESTCVSCGEQTHAACRSCFGPSSSNFSFSSFLSLFLPHQYSHSAFLPREFLDAMTQISFCLLSRRESGAYKGGWGRGGGLDINE